MENQTSAETSASSTLSIGGWSLLASSAVVELLARSGFDWIGLDAQHGQHDDASVAEVMALTADLPTPVLVRTRGHDAAEIGRYLDAGAAGVIVPLINSAADAAAAVRACLYPPLGGRSRGPFAVHRGRPSNTVEEANASVQIGVMVETAEGLRNVEDIAAVPGVGFLFVGPGDLSIDLGTTIDALAASGDGVLQPVLDAARRNGIGAGVYTNDPKHFRGFRDQGFTKIAAATDVPLLQQAAAAAVAAARS